MKFSTPYRRLRTKENHDMEINNGPILVEPGSYRSFTERIYAALASGERLAQYREAQYHYAAGDDQWMQDNWVDKTVHPSFDFAEAKEMADAAIKRQRELVKRTRAAEKAKEASAQSSASSEQFDKSDQIIQRSSAKPADGNPQQHNNNSDN